MKNQQALILGEALIDIVISPNEPTKEVCGGSPANVALGLARLGKNANLTTWIGKDNYGTKIKTYLEKNGVSLTDNSTTAPWTSTAKATIDANAAATYEFNIDWNPQTPKLDNVIVLHTGSIGATQSPGEKTVFETIEKYENTATITYDPNARPTIMESPEKVHRQITKILTKANIVKASHEDIQWLEPNKTYQEFAQELLENNTQIVAVTLAEKGVWVKTSSGIEKTYPTLATNIVDTVGAGDSFMAGIINALWDNNLLGKENLSKLKAIDENTLDKIILHASKIAAITVSRKGADLPTLEEVQRFKTN